MTSSLVGSEMCIRDSTCGAAIAHTLPSKCSASCRCLAALCCRPVSSTVSYTHLTLPTICSV
eukprot:3805082-Prorocentrum_lima.AAC.1